MLKNEACNYFSMIGTLTLQYWLKKIPKLDNNQKTGNAGKRSD